MTKKAKKKKKSPTISIFKLNDVGESNFVFDMSWRSREKMQTLQTSSFGYDTQI